jgi:hypothetical protein
MMNKCGDCGREVAYEPPGTPRQPCPNCESTFRNFSSNPSENVEAPTDSVSWKQKRTSGESIAVLDDRNVIRFEAKGRSPKNEEDAIGICARLVRELNSHGATWNKPIESIADDVDDVDGYSTDSEHPNNKLAMQVVRAANQEIWRKLAREGHVESDSDAEKLADELRAAINKKSTKYPSTQKKALALVIDAGRTPGHTFRQVVDSFKKRHLGACISCGFAQVWVVGAVDELVVRLDE